jgi:hypothetical protein
VALEVLRIPLVVIHILELLVLELMYKAAAVVQVVLVLLLLLYQVVQVVQVVVLVEVADLQAAPEAQQELVSLLQLQDGPVVVVAELVDILALVVQEEHQLEAMVLPVLAAAVVVEEEMMLQTGHQLLHIVMHQVLVEALRSMAAVAMVQAAQEILQMVIIIQAEEAAVQVELMVVTEALHMDIQVQFLHHQ